MLAPGTSARAFPFSLRSVAVVGAWLALTGSSSAATLTFPGCGATLQACIDASASGGVVQIATNTPVDDVALIGKSLTLRSAPGFAATVRGVIASNLAGPPGIGVTVEGLTVGENGIEGNQHSTGTLQVTVRNNMLLASPGSADSGRVHVQASGLGPKGPLVVDVRDNTIFSDASAGSIEGGVAVSVSNASVTGSIANNTFHVSADSSGVRTIRAVAYDSAMQLDIVGNVFEGPNIGIGIGISVYQDGGAGNVRVVNNLATGFAFGMYLVAEDRSSPGSLAVAIVNNTLADNSLAIKAHPFETATITGTFANNVVANNPQSGVDIVPSVTNAYNLVYGNGEDPDGYTYPFVPGPGTITADPEFVGAGDYRLQLTSPALNAGSNALVPGDLTLDVAGSPRILGPTVDIGAYENPCGDGGPDAGEACDAGALNGVGGCCSPRCQVLGVDLDADAFCGALDNCPAAYNPDQRNADGTVEPAPLLGDICDPCPADPADGCDLAKSGAATLGSAGGTLATTSGATVTFPPGVLADPTSVSVTGGSTVRHCIGGPSDGAICTVDADCGSGGSCFPNYGLGNSTANLVGGVSEIEPSGITFSEDVTLLLPWPDADGDGIVDGSAPAKDERDLRVFRNGKPMGVCSGAVATACTADLPCPGGANCSIRDCGSAETFCASNPTAAVCCDTAANHWTLEVRTFSEYASGFPCDPVEPKAQLKITRLGGEPGDGGLTFKGTFQIPTRLGVADVNPQTNGLGLIVEDPFGTVVAATLPAGVYDPGAKVGWKSNKAGTKWTFRNTVAPPAGIYAAAIQDQTAKAPGLVKFLVKGKKGAFDATAPVSARLVLPLEGRCVEARYPGPAPAPVCAPNGAGTTLICK